MTTTPQLVAFDLDDTLAPSKQPVPAELAGLLIELLGRVPVCVISGGRWEQFEVQVLAPVEAAGAGERELGRLHLMPTCGTRYLRRTEGQWLPVYVHDLTSQQRAQAVAALEAAARELGLWEERTWGALIEDRGSQVTFSALGQHAPVEAKRAWDPDGSKRHRLRDAVAPLLPELDVRVGGSTSVDVTLAGVDKAYGVTRLATHTGIDVQRMLFLGDQLGEGGNDAPVAQLGVPCQAVTCWQDTVAHVRDLLGGPWDDGTVPSATT